MAAVSRDTLDESAFSHPLPTVFWRDKRFFNYLYTSFNDQPAAAPAATPPPLSYILHIIIIYVYAFIYIYNIVLFFPPASETANHDHGPFVRCNH